jgi:large subunit ribosomal protein L23
VIFTWGSSEPFTAGWRDPKGLVRVAVEKTKPQIKEAVEAIFGVKVKAVNATITKGKAKRFRGRAGERSDKKKAYVMLEDGQTIDVTTGL